VKKYHFQLSSVVFTTIVTALLLGFSLNLTSGLLVYTLDDPYIHLSVAENILIGGYGVNGDEFASPSSSIIYPFILALGLFFGLGDWAPFWINLNAALATPWMVAGLLWTISVQDDRNSTIYRACFLLPLLLLAFNTAGLIFTGMEHSLQITIRVLLMSGLIALDKDKPVPLTLSIAIIFCTLIRFEGLALSGAALIALIYHGQAHRIIYGWWSGSAFNALCECHDCFGPAPVAKFSPKQIECLSERSGWTVFQLYKVNLQQHFHCLKRTLWLVWAL